MAIKVSVKWQKEVFSDLEVDTTQPPLVFKGQLYALTGVPPERQKIMVKGGLLQDDGDWSKLGLKQGQRLMMMGTADAVPVAPKTAPVFVEDLPEEDQEDAVHRQSSSAGLVNLGNTCYMNSTLQCLHAVPELKSALASYTERDGIAQDGSHLLTVAARDLFKELDKSLRPVTPMRFLQVLRQKYPQFAQRGEQGMFMQQDAEECWTQFIYTLFQRLRSSTNPPESVVSKLFEIELQSTIRSEESGEESTEKETTFTMKCHISSDVNLLHQGLKAGLKGELEKASVALNRVTTFTKESRITRLPQYLTVQFVRFFWKRESQQKAKILRKVTFPLLLDMYDFCDAKLQHELDGPRKALRDAEDEKAGVGTSNDKGKSLDKAEEPSKDSSTPQPAATATAEGMKVDGENAAAASGSGEGHRDGAAEAATAATTAAATDVPMTDAAEPQSTAAAGGNASAAAAAAPQLTGMYDLVGVLTHKGRSADSGHYVAWVKQDDGKWVEFDDDDVILRREEDITKLSGGGDWHMAYILLYKAKVPTTAPSSNKSRHSAP